MAMHMASCVLTGVFSYICISMHMHICIYIYVNTHTCLYICVSEHIVYTGTYARVCCMCGQKWKALHVYGLCADGGIVMCMCTDTYIYMNIYVYIHVYTYSIRMYQHAQTLL